MKFVSLSILIGLIPFVAPNPVATIEDIVSQKQLLDSQHTFTASLLNALSWSEGSQALSPSKIYNELLLAYFEAEGETESKLKSALRLDWAGSKSDVIRAHKLMHNGNQNKDQFKGEWLGSSTGPIVDSVGEMNQTVLVGYGVISQLNAHFIKTQLKSDNKTLSMYVMLPLQSSSAAVENLLTDLTPEILECVLTEDPPQAVFEVQLPKIETESKSLEVEELLGKDILHQMCASKRQELTAAVQKTKIEITNIASVVKRVVRGLANNRMRFICDHPFVYLIHDDDLDEILFAGVFRGSSH